MMMVTALVSVVVGAAVVVIVAAMSGCRCCGRCDDMSNVVAGVGGGQLVYGVWWYDVLLLKNRMSIDQT